MKIAIVGAGIYGVLTAIELSKVKSFSIDLFDEKGLLAGASSINQFRSTEVITTLGAKRH